MTPPYRIPPLSGKFAVLRLPLAHEMPAAELGLIIQAMSDIYFNSLSLALAEERPSGQPIEFPREPTREENLWINRLEIGSPNFIELAGLASYVLPVFGMILMALGVTRKALTVVKEGVEVKKALAESRKADAETRKIEVETASLRVDLVGKAEQLRRMNKITEETLEFKTRSTRHAEFLVREVLIKYAAEPDLVIQRNGSWPE